MVDKDLNITIEQMRNDFAPQEIPPAEEGWVTINDLMEISGNNRKAIERMVKDFVREGKYEKHPNSPIKNENYYRRVES